MKLILVCGNCAGVLKELDHSESLALAEKIMHDIDNKEFKTHPIIVPFCKECANKYMYTNGTMKEEKPHYAKVSAVNIETDLG